MTAPARSVIVPVIVHRSLWAEAETANSSKIQAAIEIERIQSLCLRDAAFPELFRKNAAV